VSYPWGCFLFKMPLGNALANWGLGL